MMGLSVPVGAGTGFGFVLDEMAVIEGLSFVIRRESGEIAKSSRFVTGL